MSDFKIDLISLKFLRNFYKCLFIYIINIMKHNSRPKTRLNPLKRDFVRRKAVSNLPTWWINHFGKLFFFFSVNRALAIYYHKIWRVLKRVLMTPKFYVGLKFLKTWFIYTSRLRRILTFSNFFSLIIQFVIIFIIIVSVFFFVIFLYSTFFFTEIQHKLLI